MYFGEPVCRLRCTAVKRLCRYFAYVAAFLLEFAVWLILFYSFSLSLSFVFAKIFCRSGGS